MSPGVRSTRSQVWLDSLGEWSWPGEQRVAAAAEAMPPPWVPTQPPALRETPAPAALPERWQRGRTLLIAVLLSMLGAVIVALAFHSELGIGTTSDVLPAAQRYAARRPLQPLPTLQARETSHAGSTIASASYPSIALHHTGSFYVYLPPGLRTSATRRDTKARYPVLYLLHGNSQSAKAFLEIGVQGELDTLIARRTIPPMIAVMIQGGPGANNWRNLGDLHYESYVLEVQELIDRMLPTVAARHGRAIAGLSMGGYGAMELALNNPSRFGVVESWLGFFNGLEYQLKLDRHTIKSLGLRAFLYGGAEDKIADPSEDAPFAAMLRAEGAHAESAVYPGEHNLETVNAHLPAMLTFAGRGLAAGASR